VVFIWSPCCDLSQGALGHSDFPEGSINPVHRESSPPAERIFETIKTRRSIRVFKDKPVKRELIEQIITGTQYAPSGHNAQSTEFAVVQEEECHLEIVRSTLEYIPKTAKQFHNPLIATLLLVLAKEEIEGSLHLLSDFDRDIQ
jgi:hypothetical protein